MHISRSMWILVVLFGAVIGSSPIWADEPPQPSRWEALIEQLASPNAKPITRGAGGRPTVTFPDNYDFAAQARIVEARRQLSDNIERALPYLVNALDDQRYSLTIDWAEGDAYYNWSVGKICRDIIAAHLEVYRDAIRFRGPGHWNDYNYDLVSRKWYAARKYGSLADLQVEALDWAIRKHIAESGGDESEERESELAELQKRRTRIRNTGKPAQPNRLLRAVIKPR